MRKRRLHVVVIYNRDQGTLPERREDRGSTLDLVLMIRQIARGLRSSGHQVSVLPLKRDLFAFQRQLRRLGPDVVFNQYEDVVHGALYEMRVAALVEMMGYPMTGSPPLALALHRYKGMAATLLQGAGVPIPPQTSLIERVRDIDGHKWRFPVIVQASQEHAGVGLDRASVVTSKKALRAKAGEVLRSYRQPALVQSFLPGREFNVGIIGGQRLRVLPLAEVDYSRLPEHIPRIMSYAAKFLETSEEYQTTSVICPAEVETELAREIGATAVRAFRAVGGWGYGRADVRLDEEKRPHVLEVNCNPCLEEGVGLARSAERAGISYPQLLQLIVRAALERHPLEVTIPMIAPLRARRPRGGQTEATP